MLAALSDSRRAFFESSGYLIVRDLVAGEELQALDQLADATLDGEIKPVDAYKGWQPPMFYTFWEPGFEHRSDLPRRERVRSMSNMCHHHPAWRKAAQSPAICEVVASLYGQSGGGVQILSDGLYMKPGGGLGANMHQDTGFHSIAAASKPNPINLWMALDPATVQNGCLFVSPGTHTTRLPHDNDPIHGRVLRSSYAQTLPNLVPIELTPGDAIFFDSALAHMSPPNRSEKSRRAFAAIYGAGVMQYTAPETRVRHDSLAGETPAYHFELIPGTDKAQQPLASRL